MVRTAPQGSPAATFGLLAVQEFRKIEAKFSIQWMAVALYVASKGTCAVADIRRDLGISETSMSMILKSLSSDSLDLIETRSDPSDNRAHIAKLTGRGNMIVATIESFYHPKH